MEKYEEEIEITGKDTKREIASPEKVLALKPVLASAD